MVRTLKNKLEFNSKTVVWIIGHATKMLNLDMVGPMGSGEVPDHMGRCVFGERVWYRVRPLTDRTKAEDSNESGMTVEETVHETVRFRRMREGTRAQGHSAVCHE